MEATSSRTTHLNSVVLIDLYSNSQLYSLTDIDNSYVSIFELLRTWEFTCIF